MNRGDIQNTIVKLYDEYNPNQVDNDLYTYIGGFLDMYVSPFISLLPVEALMPIVEEVDNNPNSILDINIGYNGGIAILPYDFSRLVSFKYNTWQTTLYGDDLIGASHPRRKLQDSKYTAGGVAKPVISLETYNREKCICFWAYDNNKGDYLCQYIPECTMLDQILSLDNWVILGYCYYTLSNIFDSISEGEKADKIKLKLQELLVSKSIIPLQPIVYNKEKK